MAKRQIVLSDLTGKVLDNPAERAELRVLEHPLLDAPVKLDAGALEIAGLKETTREFVTVEVVLPGHEPEKMVVELTKFDALFNDGVEVDDVLASAERLQRSVPVGGAPARRGRSSSSTAKPARRDPEQLRAIRDWSRANGWPDLGLRGRIPREAEEAYNRQHA